MKKIFALALALIMALSMASVAFAASATPATTNIGTLTDGADAKTMVATNNFTVVAPGEAVEFKGANWLEKSKTEPGALKGYKIAGYDFTTGDYSGASLVESVKITKELDAIRLEVKENYTMALDEAKEIYGEITYKNKTSEKTFVVKFNVNNDFDTIAGAKKAADADVLDTTLYGKNFVTIMDEDGGYVKFTEAELTGTVKMNKDEKVQLIVSNSILDDDKDAIEEYLGEDYEAIVEYYSFDGTGFKNEVAFQYDAWEEDPHFFYVWDGEKMTAIDAKYDADEEVDDYVFTGAAEGILVVTDAEIVLAAEEETKNPDTGANDVVGVAAALAVVSLVAAGAVSLKK